MWRAQYAKIVQKLGFEAHFKDFKVQNIVGSCDVKFPIRLEGLSYSHSMFSSVRLPLPPVGAVSAAALRSFEPARAWACRTCPALA